MAKSKPTITYEEIQETAPTGMLDVAFSMLFEEVIVDRKRRERIEKVLDIGEIVSFQIQQLFTCI